MDLPVRDDADSPTALALTLMGTGIGYGTADSIQNLLDAGADPNRAGALTGKTALWHFVEGKPRWYHRLRITALMLMNGACPNVRCNVRQGKAALTACRLVFAPFIPLRA